MFFLLQKSQRFHVIDNGSALSRSQMKKKFLEIATTKFIFFLLSPLTPPKKGRRSAIHSISNSNCLTVVKDWFCGLEQPLKGEHHEQLNKHIERGMADIIFIPRINIHLERGAEVYTLNKQMAAGLILYSYHQPRTNISRRVGMLTKIFFNLGWQANIPQNVKDVHFCLYKTRIS